MNKEEAIKVLNDLRQFTYEETEEAIDLAIKALNDELNCECCMWREKAEKWIPCDEKLPSESGRYLVSEVLLDDEIDTDIAYYGKPLLPLNTNKTKCGWYKTDGDGDYYVDDILAWKPLPKPYQEEQTEFNNTTDEPNDTIKTENEVIEPSDLISRADAVKAICGNGLFIRLKDAIDAINEVPSVAEQNVANVPTDTDLIIKNGKGLQDGIYNIKDGELFKYKAKGGTVRVYKLAECVSAERSTLVVPLKYPCDDCKWWNPQVQRCNKDAETKDIYTHSVSAERVDCDSCIYKTMWKEQEKAETLDRHTLDVLQERFEAEELKAHAKSSGLKEHATWNKAIRILEEYMEEGDNDND